MIVSLIVAHGKNNEIGINNELPWKLSEDLKNFKRVTRGKTIAMGRKTFESIGRALPERHNIVLTRDITWRHPDVKAVHSMTELYHYCEIMETEELVIIGGEGIYKEVIDEVDKMYITTVEAYIEKADAFFPQYIHGEWKERLSFDYPFIDDNNEYAWNFKVLERKET